MICNNSACGKENQTDCFFCTWCGNFTGSSGLGRKANLFTRWFALAIDPGIALFLWLVPSALAAAISPSLSVFLLVTLPLAYVIWYLTLMAKGQTPGKMLCGLRVIDPATNRAPTFGKMLLRETIGRFLSALFFGLGYFYALIDKNSQTFHDKLAGTVVVKATPLPHIPQIAA